MFRRALAAVAAVFLLSAAAFGQYESGGAFLIAPRVVRLPPVAAEPLPPGEQKPSPAAAEPLPAPGGKAEPEAIAAPDAKSKTKDDSAGDEKKEGKEDKEDKPVGIIASSTFLPEPFRVYWKTWDASVEVGLQGTAGNSVTSSTRVGLNAEHKAALNLSTLQVTHINTTKDQIETANNTLIDARFEHDFGKSKWNYYAHNFTEFDKFKAFDFRVACDTGLSYQWVKNDAARLLTRLGGSVSREFGGPHDVFVPELSSGVEWKHQLTKRQKIYAKVDYFPDVINFTNFRLNSKAEWEMVVAPAWGMSLKLSAFDRYDSTPEGKRPNDLNYSLLMLWAL